MTSDNRGHRIWRWHGTPITDLTREELLVAVDLLLTIEAERQELDRRIDDLGRIQMRRKLE